ncbi:MAG: hypothetical protein EZS28_013305 [Streblomastix strix]|uniref:Uncharacterized protein n=1 Tax=Streblomastix strix TaxID=222440 RepID=A0A5J4W938_9EUKA|nr:MAG: hypothetical protein EZS28_013305 [Streblomastix strix]
MQGSVTDRNRQMRLLNNAATKIQHQFRRSYQKESFRRLKESIRRIENTCTLDVLRIISPKDLNIFQGLFGGIEFPPLIYYKIFIEQPHGEIIDGQIVLNAPVNQQNNLLKAMTFGEYNNQLWESESAKLKRQMHRVPADSQPAQIGGKNNQWRIVGQDQQNMNLLGATPQYLCEPDLPPIVLGFVGNKGEFRPKTSYSRSVQLSSSPQVQIIPTSVADGFHFIKQRPHTTRGSLPQNINMRQNTIIQPSMNYIQRSQLDPNPLLEQASSAQPLPYSNNHYKSLSGNKKKNRDVNYGKGEREGQPGLYGFIGRADLTAPMQDQEGRLEKIKELAQDVEDELLYAQISTKEEVKRLSAKSEQERWIEWEYRQKIIREKQKKEKQLKKEKQKNEKEQQLIGGIDNDQDQSQNIEKDINRHSAKRIEKEHSSAMSKGSKSSSITNCSDSSSGLATFERQREIEKQIEKEKQKLINEQQQENEINKRKKQRSSSSNKRDGRIGSNSDKDYIESNKDNELDELNAIVDIDEVGDEEASFGEKEIAEMKEEEERWKLEEQEEDYDNEDIEDEYNEYEDVEDVSSKRNNNQKSESENISTPSSSALTSQSSQMVSSQSSQIQSKESRSQINSDQMRRNEGKQIQMHSADEQNKHQDSFNDGDEYDSEYGAHVKDDSYMLTSQGSNSLRQKQQKNNTIHEQLEMQKLKSTLGTASFAIGSSGRSKDSLNQQISSGSNRNDSQRNSQSTKGSSQFSDEQLLDEADGVQQWAEQLNYDKFNDA